MSKINYKRKMWKPRIILPPNKIIDLDTLYNRKKEKEKIAGWINELLGGQNENDIQFNSIEIEQLSKK